MSQALVGAAGVGLVVANCWTGQQRTNLAGLFGAKTDDAKAHAAVKQIGAELLGVTVLVLVAGSSDGAAHACLAVLGALWLIWWLTHTAGSK